MFRDWLKAAYAFLAFVKRSDTAGLKDPEFDMYKPRYLYLFVNSMTSWPILNICDTLVLLKLNNIILGFCILTRNFHFLKHVLQTFKLLCKPSFDWLSSIMSSAYISRSCG